MIVDSHLHLFRSGYGRFTQRTSPLGGLPDIEAYEALRRRHGIETGLVVCYEDEGIDPTNNGYVRELAAHAHWIQSVAFLRPSTRPKGSTIASLLSAGHCGIALYLPDEASARALYDWHPESWRLLSNAHAVISLNARPEAIRQLSELVGREAGCAFLFSHLGLPGRHEDMPSKADAAKRIAPLLELSSFANVGVKLSGLYAIDPKPPHAKAQPFMELAFERFAPENLHWGSDFSPALDHVDFEDTFALKCLDALPPATRTEIMGGGLARKLQRARSVSDPVGIKRS